MLGTDGSDRKVRATFLWAILLVITACFGSALKVDQMRLFQLFEPAFQGFGGNMQLFGQFWEPLSGMLGNVLVESGYSLIYSLRLVMIGTGNPFVIPRVLTGLTGYSAMWMHTIVFPPISTASMSRIILGLVADLICPCHSLSVYLCTTCYQKIVCPKCGSHHIRKAGYSASGELRYPCDNPDCSTKSFMLAYRSL